MEEWGKTRKERRNINGVKEKNEANFSEVAEEVYRMVMLISCNRFVEAHSSIINRGAPLKIIFLTSTDG